MKKNYLIALFAMICSFASAQIEPTTYRGAFAPAPTAAWTDTWTTFDPQNAVYGTPNVDVTTNITTNTTWTANNIYYLKSQVYVKDGATLTIEPGTVVRGDSSNPSCALIVTKGSKLIANGTVNNPIVFTSDKAAGSRVSGDWGGLVLLGKGNYNKTSGLANIEGIATSTDTQYGGGATPDDTDNSGSLKYVRIEFPGYELAVDKEINGLTFGAVGSGTTVDYVQVSYSKDDAFEWFGGAVNCKHLVALATLDDDLDTDNGFSGKVQFCLVVRDPNRADKSNSEAFESDNNDSKTGATTDGNLGTPKTSATFSNCTLVGPKFRSTLTNGLSVNSFHKGGAHIRRNTELKILNSVFMDFKEGLHLDNAFTEANATAGTMQFQNNILAGMTTNYVLNVGSSFDITTWAATNNNTTQASSAGLLTKAYDTDGLVYTGLDFRPAAVTAPSVSSSTISYNQGDVATQLSATADSGATLNWFTVATGGTAATTAPTPATTTVGTTTYYVSITSAMGVESARTSITVNVIPAAPTAASQTFCAGATVASLSATGTAIKWYDTNEATTPLTTTTALSTATYYASQTVSGVESTKTAVSVTVTPLTTTGSVTTSICAGDSYTWPANGVTYTTAQTGVTVVSDCNTATLNLTIQAAPIAGTNGVIYLNPGVIPTNAQLFAGLNGNPTVGGTWSNVANVYTYTVAATSPCTVAATATVTVSESIPTALSFCKGATVADAVSDSSLKFYTSLTGTAANLASTTVLTTKTYYATQTVNGQVSPKSAVAITVNNLPATPSALTSLSAKQICKYIDSDTPVLFSATAVGASSYIWTTTISNITESDITNDGADALISFKNVSTTPGAIGSVIVKIQDANGCISLPKALALTTTLPTAPTSLTMTSADSTPHFKGIITPADPTAVPPIPAVTGLVGLNSLVKITKVGPYMGTDTVFTLTAPVAITAASYAWTLPTGVNAIASPTVAISLSGVVTSTTPVITVDFADVESGIGSLPIMVQSVGGCGNSINRTLTLARALPSAPTKLVLTDEAIALTSTVTTKVVTKVGPYTAKETPLTLTATPFTTQGGTATSYAWILPEGVNCETFNTPTTVKVKSTVNTGTELEPIYAINDVAAIATASSTITINFDDVQSGVTSLPIQVFGVNGAGNSIARTLALTAAVPATPAIVGSGGNGTSAQFGSCLTKTYTATLIPGATYNWTVPGNAPFTGGNGNVIVVDYSNTAVAIGALGFAVTCTAINGTGPSITKSLTVKRIACTNTRLAPEAATTEKFSAMAYPNPSTEGFRVKSSNGKSFGVQVYDMLGRSIEQRQISSDSEIGSNYAKGIYNVIVNQGANVKTLRVIKQ